MSLLVVDRLEQLERISKLTEAVKKASVSEASNKKQYEKKVNRFLDSILDQKRFLRERADAAKGILPDIEQFSWFSDLDESGEASMRTVITLMNELYIIMRGRYIKANVFFTRNSIGTQELKEYKAAAVDIRELAVDLHERFFVFPGDNEFQAITKELNGL